jgi:hypothetical protein
MQHFQRGRVDAQCGSGRWDLTDHHRMKTLFSMLGLIGAGMFMAALYLNAPSAGPVEAREGKASDCPMMEVAVDEDYGVTLKALRPVCGKAH